MKALLVIDMQNAFFEDPDLAKSQDSVVSGCNELIDGFTSAGQKVLLVRTEHERDKSTWTLNMLDDDQGFIFRDSDQAQFVPNLKVEGHPQLLKTRDSAFVDTDLLARLRNWNVEQVLLAGVSSHNCLAHTAADAFARNIRVTYARDAMASEDRKAESDTLRILTNEYRQTVRTNKEILADLA